MPPTNIRDQLQATLGTTLLCASLIVVAATARAQQPMLPHALGPMVAEARESFGNINSVRALSDGRVLVNDAQRHRVLLLDQTLGVIAVVADSTAGAVNGHGNAPGMLIRFTGDSTVFVDTRSLSFLVVDPAGRIARVMSPPRPEDVALFTRVTFGAPGIDPQGRLVYRAALPHQMVASDSAPIVRVAMLTRAIDTVAYMSIPHRRLESVSTREQGRLKLQSLATVVDPLPVTDDWALMSDGTVALARGRDYHIDWIDPEGQRSASSKIPYPWERLTDNDKAAVTDSTRAQLQASLGPDSATTSFVMVTASELPDYRPAFRPGALRAAPDTTLWVATTCPSPRAPGLVYDVIDRAGVLVDRVAIPAGRAVIGFDLRGGVYLTWRDGAGMHLALAYRR